MGIYLPDKSHPVNMPIFGRVEGELPDRHHPGMKHQTVDDVRLANLRLLMERHRAKDFEPGWERRFAESVAVNPTYLPQIKARTKSIGTIIARRIERQLKLADGWMDVPHDESAPRDDAEAMFLMTMMSLYRRAPGRARVLLEELLKEAQAK